MKTKLFFLGIIIILLTSTTAFYKTRFQEQERPSDNLVYLQSGTVSETIQDRGVFVPIEKAKLFAEVSGQVKNLTIKAGDRVHKNQTVVRVDSTELDHQLNQAEITVKTQRLEAETLASQIEKKRILAEKQIVTQEEFQNINTKYNRLTLEIKASEEKIRYLKNKKSLYVIKSPISGVVSSLSIENGQIIEPGTVLMEIQNTQTLKLEVFIREYETYKIKKGQKVLIKSPVFSDQILTGVVSLVIPVVQTQQNQPGMKVEITLKDDLSTFNIHPGNQADIEIVLNKKENCLYLPIGAVKEDNGQYFVILETTLERRPVQVGYQDKNRIEILSGLEASEGVLNAFLY